MTFHRFFRSTGCALVGAVVLSTPLYADGGLLVGTASYHYHTDAFRSLADTFFGATVPLGLSSGAGTGSTSITPVLSLRFGYQHVTENIVGSGLNLTSEISFNQTRYYFPNGISPFLDPITTNLTAVDVQAVLGKTTVLLTSGNLSLTAKANVGVGASMVSSHLTSALLNVRDEDVFSWGIVQAGLDLQYHSGTLGVTLSQVGNGTSEIKITQSFRW